MTPRPRGLRLITLHFLKVINVFSLNRSVIRKMCLIKTFTYQILKSHTYLWVAKEERLAQYLVVYNLREREKSSCLIDMKECCKYVTMVCSVYCPSLKNGTVNRRNSCLNNQEINYSAFCFIWEKKLLTVQRDCSLGGSGLFDISLLCKIRDKIWTNKRVMLGHP